jgi:hypothetical protein
MANHDFGLLRCLSKQVLLINDDLTGHKFLRHTFSIVVEFWLPQSMRWHFGSGVNERFIDAVLNLVVFGGSSGGVILLDEMTKIIQKSIFVHSPIN